MNKEITKRHLNSFVRQYKIKRMYQIEKKKINDTRKKKIYEGITLSEQQKREIDSIFVRNYEKIDYRWHRLYSAYSGQFDAAYFPEILYTSKFEFYMNLNERYKVVYSDKALLEIFAKAADIKMPRTIVMRSNGQFMTARDGNALNFETVCYLLHDIGEVFIKPTIDSNSGRGCILAVFRSGVDTISGKKVDELLWEMGLNFIVQERLKCQESIAAIYPCSVNTFRIISYRWKNQILHMPIIMRIGKGGNYLDNAHAGGMFIAVDDDGRLHDKAYTEFNDQYEEHPDTGFVFKGQMIPGVGKVITASVKMHELMPELGVVNFDFTLNQAGEPVLVEANCETGSIWLPQMAHGKGAFGNLTGEVLRWISFMDKNKYNDLSQYQFGKIDEPFHG